MTREEAIGHIKDVICENNTIKPNIVVFEQEKEALYMAIKAIEQQNKLFKTGLLKDCESCKALEQESKTGHWIFTKTMFDKHGCTAECSDCRKKWKTYDTIRFEKEHNYCPNCGAKINGNAIYQGFEIKEN